MFRYSGEAEWHGLLAVTREEEQDPATIRTIAIAHLKAGGEWHEDWDPDTDLTEPLIKGEVSKLRRNWGKPNQLVLVVRDASDRIIGYHWASCDPLEERIERMPWYPARIHGLWVHPGWRRRGITFQLKSMLEAWALDRGCEMIEMIADLDNGLGLEWCDT